MIPIELREECALEAINAIDAAIMSGERPTVVVNDLEGLNHAFVKALMLRDDVDVVLSEDSILDLEGDRKKSRYIAAALYFGVAVTGVLVSIGASLMLAP